MKKFIPEEVIHHTAAALDVVQTCSRYGACIGLDVHKETIAVAVALVGWMGSRKYALYTLFTLF